MLEIADQSCVLSVVPALLFMCELQAVISPLCELLLELGKAFLTVI